MSAELITIELNSYIHIIRGKHVILDKDLATLYGAETRTLNQAVKRNLDRFPEDFMFQINEKEFTNLRSQIVISNIERGGRRFMPFVFTEQGIAMLSSVLNSKQAIQVNIHIMRAFVKMRRLTLSIVDVRRKIDNMENKYDSQFKIVFDALRGLLAPEPKNRNSIGFVKEANK